MTACHFMIRQGRTSGPKGTQRRFRPKTGTSRFQSYTPYTEPTPMMNGESWCVLVELHDKMETIFNSFFINPI